jgi:hypothetical protein
MLPAELALIKIGKHPMTANAPGWAEFVLESPESASRELYDVLHRCDALEKTTIIVVLPPEELQWSAVRDRLMRATLPLSQR